MLVAADEGDEYDVSLLSLESIDGVYGDEMAHLSELLSAAYLLAYILRLHTIGGYDADVDTLFEESADTNLVDVAL